MYLNPNTAIENGWIKFPEWMSEADQAKCIQPNAIDITIDTVYQPDPVGSFMLSEDSKQMIKQTEQYPDSDGYFVIPAHSFVDVMSDFFITVPPGMVATFIVRSSLNRNGIFITNGLYDQGFSNNCGLILHNRHSTPAKIKHQTRIGQLCFITAQDSGMLYEGSYNNNKGQHWTENT